MSEESGIVSSSFYSLFEMLLGDNKVWSSYLFGLRNWSFSNSADFSVFDMKEDVWGLLGTTRFSWGVGWLEKLKLS